VKNKIVKANKQTNIVLIINERTKTLSEKWNEYSKILRVLEPEFKF